MPNDQDNNGTELRVCGADGEWGPWQPLAWGACAISPGSYVFSYSQPFSANACPDIADEVVTLRTDGTTITQATEADCEIGEPDYNVAQCQLSASIACETSLGGGRSLRQSSVLVLNTLQMAGVFSATATGYENGSAVTACQSTYDVTVTRL